MKITIEDQLLTYTCDFSKKINENDGFQDEYNPSVEEAVDMALYLLGCVFSNKSVAKYLHQHIPAMDYWTGE